MVNTLYSTQSSLYLGVISAIITCTAASCILSFQPSDSATLFCSSVLMFRGVFLSWYPYMTQRALNSKIPAVPCAVSVSKILWVTAFLECVSVILLCCSTNYNDNNGFVFFEMSLGVVAGGVVTALMCKASCPAFSFPQMFPQSTSFLISCSVVVSCSVLKYVQSPNKSSAAILLVIADTVVSIQALCSVLFVLTANSGGGSSSSAGTHSGRPRGLSVSILAANEDDEHCGDNRNPNLENSLISNEAVSMEIKLTEVGRRKNSTDDEEGAALFSILPNDVNLAPPITQPLTPPSPLNGSSTSRVKHRLLLRSSNQLDSEMPSSTLVVQRTLNWKKGVLLGRGAFGEVHVALNLDNGMMMAVKEVTLDPHDPKLDSKLYMLQSEISILKKLDHENVIKYFFVEKGVTGLNIFMEYAAGGSLSLMLKTFGPLPESVVVQYTHQILLGLRHLHDNDILHADIKCCNILLNVEGVVKLADFGAATIAKERVQSNGDTSRGTPVWMAPEVLRGEDMHLPADVWSLGCTVMEMLTGTLPWSHLGNPVEVMGLVASESTSLLLPPNLTVQATRFLRDCFRFRPEDRPTANSLLNHEFFFEPDPASVRTATTRTLIPTLRREYPTDIVCATPLLGAGVSPGLAGIPQFLVSSTSSSTTTPVTSHLLHSQVSFGRMSEDANSSADFTEYPAMVSRVTTLLDPPSALPSRGSSFIKKESGT